MMRGLAAAAVALLLLTGCSKPPSHAATPGPSGSSGPPRSVPPVPQEPGDGSGQAPLAWIGGTILAVSDRQVVIRETLGPKVELRRLGQDATAFFQVIGGAWQRVEAGTAARGGLACVETLLDGRNLLALRVFLGVGCGPAG
jgi:hypothetical protein